MTTTTVLPNTFSESLQAPSAPDLGENFSPATEGINLETQIHPRAIDLDGKLEEENFGQSINENVTVEDVSQPLTKPAKNKKK